MNKERALQRLFLFCAVETCYIMRRVINMREINTRDLLVKIIVLPIAAYGLYSIVRDQFKK